jgi:hypothetical protein
VNESRSNADEIQAVTVEDVEEIGYFSYCEVCSSTEAVLCS